MKPINFRAAPTFDHSSTSFGQKLLGKFGSRRFDFAAVLHRFTLRRRAFKSVKLSH